MKDSLLLCKGKVPKQKGSKRQKGRGKRNEQKEEKKGGGVKSKRCACES
jgi:hypothetical protein